MDWSETGSKIRAARLSLGLSVDEVGPYIAEKTGITISGKTINRIENGNSTKLKTLETVCQALGLSLTLQVTNTAPAPEPSLDDLCAGMQRIGLVRRLVAVVDQLPQDHADILLSQVSIWERKYAQPVEDDFSDL